MADFSEIALVLLGAGVSRRFGGDKLAARLGGEPVLRFSAGLYAALPFKRRIAVLGPGTAGVADLGFREVRREEAEAPMAASLAAGIEALGADEPGGIMIALADMPLVTPAHLGALAAAYDGTGPVCSELDGAPCPPAIFPTAMKSALAVREGDHGARALLADALRIAAGEEVLIDIDTPEALARAETLLNLR